MRRKLRAALRLSPAERALFGRAWARLLCVGLGLRFLPLPRVQSLLSARPRRPAQPAVPASRLADLVATAARHQPLPVHCLERSLVLQSLLRDQGIEAHLRIGVRRMKKKMEAHAWVEQEGRVIGDAPELVRLYLPLEGPADKPSPGLA